VFQVGENFMSFLQRNPIVPEASAVVFSFTFAKREFRQPQDVGPIWKQAQVVEPVTLFSQASDHLVMGRQRHVMGEEQAVAGSSFHDTSFAILRIGNQ